MQEESALWTNLMGEIQFEFLKVEGKKQQILLSCGNFQSMRTSAKGKGLRIWAGRFAWEFAILCPKLIE